MRLDRVAASRLVDRESALEIIEYAAKELISGRTLQQDLANWLGFALLKIAQGEKPEDALGLSKRGTPPKLSWEDVLPFVHDGILDGRAWTTVCAEAAVSIGELRGERIDEKTIRLIYEDALKDWYDGWIDDPPWGESICDEGRQRFLEFTRQSVASIMAVRSSIPKSRTPKPRK